MRATVSLPAGRKLSVSALGFFRSQGLPGFGTRQTRFTTLEVGRAITSVAYDSSSDLGPTSKLHLHFYYSFEQQRFRDAFSEISILPTLTRDRSDSFGSNFHFSRRLAWFVRLAGVVELRYEQIAPRDAFKTPPQAPIATRLFVGTGAEVDFWWARLRLHVIPSLRLEVSRDARIDVARNGAVTADSAALLQALPLGRLAFVEEATAWLTLRANVARYERLPSSSELYGNSGFLLGNTKLEPEAGYNADLGGTIRLRKSWFAVVVEPTLFASFVDNLIQFQEVANGRARALNLGRARVLGVELALQLEMTRFARLLAQATFTDARDVSDTSIGRLGPQLPLRPRFHLYARPEVHNLRLGKQITAGAYLEFDFTDEDYVDPANFAKLPARFLLGAGVYADALQRRLQVIASAQNLTDARVFDVAGFPLPSRAFFVSLRVKTEKEKEQ